MSFALSAGVTGLQAHQKMLDVAGNNLANVNTTAFKASRITFSELLSETIRKASQPSGSTGGTNPQQMGSGVGVAGISPNMSQGNIVNTGSPLDMAIEGEGYFVLTGTEGDVFTRAGSFSVDADGNLVDPGTGYLVQRILSAKDEKNSVGATLLFNVAHYALRPWPWIIVSLCSLIVFPDLASLKAAFPNVESGVMGHDLAYPAMLTFLPAGLLGLVLASLIAAYMSTISTHLNWGSSYVVNDVYKRFIRPDASEKHLVFVGRVSTLLLMVGACCLAPFLENAKRAFDLMLQIGAGTGLLFILRWFWWRINAFSEFTAMIISFMVACYFEFVHTNIGLAEFASWQKLIIGVGITTSSWIFVTLVTKPTSDKTLRSFYSLVQPGGPGWEKVLQRAKADNEPVVETAKKGDLPFGILCMVLGCFAVYSALFSVGCWIYANYTSAITLTVVAIVSTVLLIKAWSKLDIKPGLPI